MLSMVRKADQLRLEERKGRQAREQLSLIDEFLESRKQALYSQFCNARTYLDGEELVHLRSQVQAVANLEDYLEELVTTGQLAITQMEEE
jgi:hypothetical protein